LRVGCSKLRQYIEQNIEKISFDSFYAEMQVLSDIISATEKSLYLEKYYMTRGYAPYEYLPVIQEMEGDTSGNTDTSQPPANANAPTEPPKPENPQPNPSEQQPQSQPTSDNKQQVPAVVTPNEKRNLKQDTDLKQPEQKPTNPTPEPNADNPDAPEQPEQEPSKQDQSQQLPQTNWEKFKNFVKELIHKIVEGIGKMIDSLFGGNAEADVKQSESSVQKLLQEEPDAADTISQLQEIVKKANPVDAGGQPVNTESYNFIDTDLMLIEWYDQHSDEFEDFYQEALLNDIVKGLDASTQLISQKNIVEAFRTAGKNTFAFVDNIRKFGLGVNKQKISDDIAESINKFANGAVENAGNNIVTVLTAGISNHTDLTESYGTGGPTKFVKFGPILPEEWDPNPSNPSNGNPPLQEKKNFLKNMALQLLKKANDNGQLDNLMEGRNENDQLVGWYLKDSRVPLEDYNKPGGPKPVALLTNEDGFSYGGNLVTNTVNQVRGFKRLLDIFNSSAGVVTDIMSKFGAEPPACLSVIADAAQFTIEKTNDMFGSTDISQLGGAKGKFFLYLGLDITKKTIIRRADKNNNENNVIDALLGGLLQSLTDIANNAQRVVNAVDQQIQNQMIAQVSNDSAQIAKALNDMDRFFAQDGDGSIIDVITGYRNSAELEANRFKAVQKALMDIDTLMHDPNTALGKLFASAATSSLPKDENTGYHLTDKNGNATNQIDANLFDAKEALGDVAAHTPIPKSAFKANDWVSNKLNQVGEAQEKSGMYDKNKTASTNDHTAFTSIFTSFFQAVSGLLPLMHYMCGLSNDVLNFGGALIDGVSAAHDARLNQGDYRYQLPENAFKDAYQSRMNDNGGLAGHSQVAVDDNARFTQRAEDNARLESKLNAGLASDPVATRFNIGPAAGAT